MLSQPGIDLGHDDHGARVSLPVGAVTAGHSLLAGAPDSGRRETALQLLGSLIEGGHRTLVVDGGGEFETLGQTHGVLRVSPTGAGSHRVDPTEASRLVDLVVQRSVPVVLDLSTDATPDATTELLARTLRRLLERVRTGEVSVLLAISGVDQYVPAEERLGEAGRTLSTIASDGPNAGLGLLGTTRRVAALKRDVITDTDWMIWHRLDRSVDGNAVGRILGRQYASEIADLPDGVGLLQRQWTDRTVCRVRIPGGGSGSMTGPDGLTAYERPDIDAKHDDPIENWVESGGHPQIRSRLTDLRADMDAILDRLDRLAAPDTAAVGDSDSSAPRSTDSTASDESRARTDSAVVSGSDTAAASTTPASSNAADTGVTDVAFGDLAGIGDGNTAGSSESTGSGSSKSDVDSQRRRATADTDRIATARRASGTGRGIDHAIVDDEMARLRRKGEQLAGRDGGENGVDPDRPDLLKLLEADPVVDAIDAAATESLCTCEQAWSIVGAVLAHGPATITELASSVPAAADGIESVLDALESRSLVVLDENARYSLHESELRTLGKPPTANR